MLEIAVAGDTRSSRASRRSSRRRPWPRSGALLPLESRIIHARWSGESCWIPFGDLDVGFGPENATCYPAPGQLLFYPGGVSETEILFPYGPTALREQGRAARRATTSPRSWKAPTTSASWAARCSGTARSRSAPPRPEPPKKTAPHPLMGGEEVRPPATRCRAYRRKARLSVTASCRKL